MWTCSFGQVHDLHIRLVPQIVDFSPEQRDASSYLNETVPLDSLYSSVPTHGEPSPRVDVNRIGQYHLLGLVIIGHVPRGIDSSGKVSCSSTVTRSSRDEGEEDIVVVDGRRPEFNG